MSIGSPCTHRVAVTKRRATRAHSDSGGNSQPDWLQPLYGRVERRGAGRRSTSCRITRHGRQLRAGNRTRDTSSDDPGKEGKDQNESNPTSRHNVYAHFPKDPTLGHLQNDQRPRVPDVKTGLQCEGMVCNSQRNSERESYSRSQSLQQRKRIKDAPSRRRQCAASLLVLE